MTPQDQMYMQNSVDDVYRTFKSRVAASRKLSMEKVEQLAQGRIYTGQQAKDIGLVDEIGDLKEAFQFAKKEAGFDPNKLYPIHRYEPPVLSAAECLRSLSHLRKCIRKHGSHARRLIVRSMIGPELHDVEALIRSQKTAKEGGVLAILPIDMKM
jgi:protease-4